ncbi:hypothetical protein MRX96_046122 [Rhipicephalus microplus]
MLTGAQQSAHLRLTTAAADVEETLPALYDWSRVADAPALQASSCEQDEQLPLLSLEHTADWTSTSLLVAQQQAPWSQPHVTPPEIGDDMSHVRISEVLEHCIQEAFNGDAAACGDTWLVVGKTNIFFYANGWA